MNKLRLLAGLVFLAALVLFAKPALAQSTQDFTIKSFDANYYLDRRPDGVPTMQVDEVIVAEFPNYDQNHGLLRALPQDYKNQPLNLKIQSVTDASGRAYKYSTSTSNGNLVLKIGDANKYVRGQHTYHLTYSLQNPISFWDDHDEFYWNINGTQWLQPFDKVTAKIHIPASLDDKLQTDQVCYTGISGSTASDCTISRSDVDGQKVVSVTALDLPVGGNLSVVLGFTKDTFAIDQAAQRAKIIQFAARTLALTLPPLLTLLFLIKNWYRNGRDPRGRGTIIPEYTPPKGLDSLTSDVLLHEKLRNKAVTALLIELAIRKYVALAEVQVDKLIGKKTDYQLTLLKAPDDLNSHQKAVLKMFFKSLTVGSQVTVSSLKNTMATDFKSLTSDVPAQLTTDGYFAHNPVKVVTTYRIIGAFLLPGGAGIAVWTLAASPFVAFLGVGLGLSGFLVLLFARVMPARTAKGVQNREHLFGLRDYMQLAEADRIKYLQSPKGVRQWGDPKDPKTQIKLFEKLLPYAMIFNIEKDWAKQFQDIYTEAPDWYHGNWNAFSAGYLVGSLGSFNTVSAAAFAPASSSSSSGFGGGGFSGGGGGGGGGGGW